MQQHNDVEYQNKRRQRASRSRMPFLREASNISGLGMDDPVDLAMMVYEFREKLGKIFDDEESVADAHLFCQNEDRTSQLRHQTSNLSVISDHTATSRDGFDKEFFHTSLSELEFTPNLNKSTCPSPALQKQAPPKVTPKGHSDGTQDVASAQYENPAPINHLDHSSSELEFTPNLKVSSGMIAPNSPKRTCSRGRTSSNASNDYGSANKLSPNRDVHAHHSFSVFTDRASSSMASPTRAVHLHHSCSELEFTPNLNIGPVNLTPKTRKKLLTKVWPPSITSDDHPVGQTMTSTSHESASSRSPTRSVQPNHSFNSNSIYISPVAVPIPRNEQPRALPNIDQAFTASPPRRTESIAKNRANRSLSLRSNEFQLDLSK